MSGQVRDLWQGCYKIPWHEEDFSRRMLREHLTQEHDLASRRAQWIEAQVGFINERILRGAESQPTTRPHRSASSCWVIFEKHHGEDLTR